MGHPVQISGAEVAAALRAYSREPFHDILASLLAAQPDPEAVKEFARKYPDRWAQAVAIFGRLAGFSEKIKVETNITLKVAGMSDAGLLDRLEQVRALLDAPKNAPPHSD